MNAETPINELIVIEPKDARALFTTDDPVSAMSPILGKVRAAIDAWTPPDVTTTAGRKEVASFAHKVTKSKTYLEGIGKELAAEAKKIPSLIDATRRHNVRTLEAWAEEVRKPLTEWEAKEDARVQRHSATLGDLGSMAHPRHGATADELRGMIDRAEAINPADGEEYAGEIEVAKSTALAALRTALDARIKADADAAELEALRKANAERIEAEAKARHDQELEDAAERAATAAAAKAKADQEAKERAEAEALRKREANTAHRRKVNRAAVADLVAKARMTEEAAIDLVTRIARGDIANISINY